jgi:diguanylate cyclase (GGDEF)-like protein
MMNLINPVNMTVLMIVSFLWSAHRLTQTRGGGLGSFIIVSVLSVGVLLMTHSRLVYVLFPLAGAAALFGIWIYVLQWNRRTEEIGERLEATHRDVEVLEKRYQTRMESLKHLERRVGGLQKLFEVAKDLNECLSFNDLMHVLQDKVTRELEFLSGMILILDQNRESKAEVQKLLSFGSGGRSTDSETTREIANVCLLQALKSKRFFTYDQFDDLARKELTALKVKAPLWAFPLLAENKLIALLVVEDGQDNDLASFELLASQLSLQVEKVQLYEAVHELSIIDGLTKTFVRRHFLERFSEELKRAARYSFPLSVLMVDVDEFKGYNDKFGHLVGDRTLCEVARIIRENVRPVDVIGRYGGEEFVIVAPEIEKEKGLELAERIRSAVARKRFRIYDEETRATISIGVSAFPKDVQYKPGQEFQTNYIEVLLQKADEALYRAKEEGRNRVVEFS